jgi:hypothetical protein
MAAPSGVGWPLSRSRRGPDVKVIDGPALPATMSGRPLPFQVGRIAHPSDAAKPFSGQQTHGK